MTITRIVNGKSMQFMLNSRELYQAYIEQYERYRNEFVRRTQHIEDPAQTRTILQLAKQIMEEYGYGFESAVDQAAHELCLN